MVTPEPEKEAKPERPEPQLHRSVFVQSKSRPSGSAGDGGSGSRSSVRFAADTKANDGPRRSGLAWTVGRVCGKAFVNTLAQAGWLMILVVFVLLCIRAWSGTIFLWEGSLDDAWSRTHSWLPSNPYPGPLVRSAGGHTHAMAFCCFSAAGRLSLPGAQACTRSFACRLKACVVLFLICSPDHEPTCDQLRTLLSSSSHLKSLMRSFAGYNRDATVL